MKCFYEQYHGGGELATGNEMNCWWFFVVGFVHREAGGTPGYAIF